MLRVSLPPCSLETIPPVAASTYRFPCLLIDENVAQGPGVRAEKERFEPMFLRQISLFRQRRKREVMKDHCILTLSNHCFISSSHNAVLPLLC